MQSKQKGSINCMGESRQLTPGVVSRRYLLEEDESGREKEAGEGHAAWKQMPDSALSPSNSLRYISQPLSWYASPQSCPAAFRHGSGT